MLSATKVQFFACVAPAVLAMLAAELLRMRVPLRRWLWTTAALLLPARPRTSDEGGRNELEMWLSGARRLRAVPSAAGPVVGAAGGSVSVLQLDGEWAHVRGDNADGWVSRHFLHAVPSPTVDV